MRTLFYIASIVFTISGESSADINTQTKTNVQTTATTESGPSFGKNGCVYIHNGYCATCSNDTVSGCTAVTCNANKFDTNGDATDGCEAGCAAVTDGTCTDCDSALASGCTAVTCATNKFDTNVDATDGCEVGCPAVADGTCDTCSDKDTCTSVTCNSNKFNSDSNFNNGCESSFNCNAISAIADTTCTACSSSSVCTAIAACTNNKFDSDADPTNGCESSFDCSAITVADTTCKICSDASTCTTIGDCFDNRFDTNGNAADGCEAGCAAVGGGTCTACKNDNSCDAVACDENFFDTNGNAADGCEQGCPFIIGGDCETCSTSTTCDTCANSRFVVKKTNPSPSSFCSMYDQDKDVASEDVSRYPDCKGWNNDATTPKCQCWTKDGNTLYNDDSSISICDSTYNYCNDDYGHCLEHNYCPNMNGVSEITEKCSCGLPTATSPFSFVGVRTKDTQSKSHITVCGIGDYCFASTGTCKTTPIEECANINGNIKNEFDDTKVECACGDTGACDSSKPFCSWSNSRCTTNVGNGCVHTEGLILNEKPCSCGNDVTNIGGVANCAADTFCTVRRDGSGVCNKAICPIDQHSLCDDRSIQSNDNNPLYFNGFEFPTSECATPGCDTDADVQQCCKPCLERDWDTDRHSCSRGCPSGFDCSPSDVYILPPLEYRYDPTKLDEYSSRELARFNKGFTGYCRANDEGICQSNDQNIQTCCLETDKCSYQENTLCIPSQGHYKPSDGWNTTVCEGVLCRPDECCDFAICKCANGIAHLPPTCHKEIDVQNNFCQSCDNSFFLNGTFCQSGSTCHDNQYVIKEANTNSDTLCGPLTTCNDDEYIQTNHTNTSDRGCAKLTICNDIEQYESVPNTKYSDRQCQDISPPCNTAQYESKSPSPTSDRQCQDISPPCNPTTHWQSQEPNETQDRICQQLADACNNDQYESQEPTLTQNRICQDRTDCVPATQYESFGGTSTSDRICSDLTVCSPYEYISTRKTTVSDRQCLPLTTCNSSQYASRDPGVSTESGNTGMYISNRECSTCPTDSATCRGCMDPEDCHYDNRALVHSVGLCSGKTSTFYTYTSTVFENKEGQQVDNVVLKNNDCVRFEPVDTDTGMFVVTGESTLRNIYNDDGTLYYASFQVPIVVGGFSVSYSYNGEQFPFNLQQDCVKETVLNTTVCVVTNKTCVDGIMKGTRAIWWKELVPASNGGEECTTNPYYEECDNVQCDVDCQEECNDTWSECLNPQGNAVQCGENGTNTKQCTVQVESKHAGTKCTPVQTKNCTGLPSENDCDCRGNVLDGCGVCGGTCCPPGEHRDRCGICGGTNQCDSLLKLRASLKHDRSKVMRLFVPVAVFVLFSVAFVGFFFCLCNREQAVEVTNKKNKKTLIF